MEHLYQITANKLDAMVRGMSITALLRDADNKKLDC